MYTSAKPDALMDVEKKLFLEKRRMSYAAFTLFLSILYRYKIEFNTYFAANLKTECKRNIW